jgi:NitT/TauT family transport system substrate-binding protein
VEVAELGFPETLSALSNNAIDGSVIVEPFVTLAEERGLAGIWRRVPEYLPVHQTGVLMYGPSIMQAPGDVAVRFMKGYLRGARDYNVAVERRDAAIREQVIAILMEQTTLKDRALYDRISYAWLDPDGRVVMDSIADDLGWYVDHGYVRERLDLARVVDSSFAERAVAQLGPFSQLAPR